MRRPCLYSWLYICHVFVVVAGVGSFMSFFFVVIGVGVLGMSVLYACWIC
jgi:hypothetical protein